jgi:hypothetical protein
MADFPLQDINEVELLFNKNYRTRLKADIRLYGADEFIILRVYKAAKGQLLMMIWPNSHIKSSDKKDVYFAKSVIEKFTNRKMGPVAGL